MDRLPSPYIRKFDVITCYLTATRLNIANIRKKSVSLESLQSELRVYPVENQISSPSWTDEKNLEEFKEDQQVKVDTVISGKFRG